MVIGIAVTVRRGVHSLFFGDESDLDAVGRYWLRRIYLNSEEKGLLIAENEPLRLKFDANSGVV